MSRVMLAALWLGCVAAAGAAEEIKSGPEVGKSVSAFHPLNVTGAAAGEKACLV